MMFRFKSILQIWIILIGFRDTNDFVNLGICKHEVKFACSGYCRFTLTLSYPGGGRAKYTPSCFSSTILKRLKISSWNFLSLKIHFQHTFCKFNQFVKF